MSHLLSTYGDTVRESVFVHAPQKVTDIKTPLRVRETTGESMRRDDTFLFGAR